MSNRWAVGLNLHNATSGAAGVRYNSIQGLINYKIPIAKSLDFNLGSRFGTGKFETVNASNLTFENNLLGLGNNEVLNENGPLSYRMGGFAAVGMRLGAHTFNFGVDSRYNWLSSLQNGTYINDQKWLHMYSIHNELALSDNVTMDNYITYQTLNEAYELQGQFNVNWGLNNNQKLITGVGMRYKDALQFVLGYEFNKIGIYLGYDHHISNLRTESGGVGALELVARLLFKKKKRKPRMLVYADPTPILPAGPVIFEDLYEIPLDQITETPANWEDRDLARLVEEAFADQGEDVTTDDGSSDGEDTITSETSRDDVITPLSYIDEGGSTVFVPPIIYYDFDIKNVNENYFYDLKKVAGYMKANPEANVILHAHTDQRGTTTYNTRLSKNRALDARRILRALGIDKSRISYEYYGKTIPAIDCNFQDCTETQHSLNRRTEVEFTVK